MVCMRIEGNPDNDPSAPQSEGAMGGAESPMIPRTSPIPEGVIPKPPTVDPEIQSQLEQMDTDGGWDHREARAA